MVSSLAQAILEAGVDDWVPLRAIDGLAVQLRPDDSLSERKAAVLDVLKGLMGDGLVVVGDVTDGGFFEWPEDQVSSLARLTSDYAVEDPRHWEFAVWVANTPRGDINAKLNQHPD